MLFVVWLYEVHHVQAVPQCSNACSFDMDVDSCLISKCVTPKPKSHATQANVGEAPIDDVSVPSLRKLYASRP